MSQATRQRKLDEFLERLKERTDVDYTQKLLASSLATIVVQLSDIIDLLESEAKERERRNAI